jgi:hypothetical protein
LGDLTEPMLEDRLDIHASCQSISASHAFRHQESTPHASARPQNADQIRERAIFFQNYS